MLDVIQSMAGGIIHKIFDKKTKYMTDYYTAFQIEDLKHELVIAIAKELESFPSGKSYEISAFRKWLIGDN